MAEKLRSLGLCLGASTVSIVQLELNRSIHEDSTTIQKPRVIDFALHPHEGDPKQTLLNAFNRLKPDSFDRIAATGRKFRKFVNLSSISEPEAVEYAYPHVKSPDIDCPAVVSAGGETFMVYALNRTGSIANVITGNKCASGTGEFFLQQLRRMDASLEEAAQWAAVEQPHHVSGRCSVFCKSDCTHATNKGIPKSQVTAGLCKMMANKILELLKKVERRNIMVVGGTARNRMMIEYLQQEIPGLFVPDEAPYFEALGAALWALDNETAAYPGHANLLLNEVATFDNLPPLQEFAEQVEFKTMATGKVQPEDNCILGLDVGSTTTKAVLMRTSDNAMLASVYLRTSGDPIGASRRCYASILDQVRQQVDPTRISVSGLAVTGSGRQIAGLHGLTDGVINEIIAHATAAVYFDPKVDTIFEIGGQDAKYTYITNAVPSDYAMNEACSAGTGSFLEESALETLGVQMEDIADIALNGKRPPNFNDQCAAFIASDIKNAIHEGIAHEDIVGGLVYSICMNYSNRVKGNRPVGEKVFMQGGVCYNKAVPLAMASLVGKPIIVPPEPGLMGAFGVALEVKNRIESGLMPPERFDLQTLVEREVVYKKPFTCRGGQEKCDRRCEIAMIEIEGQKYPFGGACNRYYNLRHKVSYDIQKLDLVRMRQELIFNQYGAGGPQEKRIARRGTIGFNRSFLVNTYYPLYSHFFAELGYDIVMPDTASQEGVDQRNAAFCYPVELAHGFFYTLLEMENPPDYIFLPHFKAVPGEKNSASSSQSQVCPLVQGETFYLQTTFRKKIDQLKLDGTRLLTPLIDLSIDLDDARQPLVKTAAKMGISRTEARRAFDKALQQQRACQAQMKALGRQMLHSLAEDPQKYAVVIFSRPYNGFVEEAHMGIPHKFASRGIPVIPLDFLDLEEEHSKRHMYWGMGKLMMKAARFVERHPQLFGTYITNFSCGPDSFVVSYFRDIMGRKPSLTLELDSHTADAGLETRVEAFLDIVNAYRQLVAGNQITAKQKTFQPAKTVLNNGTTSVVTSSGEMLPMTDPRVTVLLPSMGKYGSEAFAAVLRGYGFNALAHRPSDEAVLKMGRANTTCKECLPLILTTGTLLSYIHNGRSDDEVLVYFFATGSGPCRFGQYSIFMEDLVKRLEIPDVALLTLTSENSYVGLGNDFETRAWWAVVVSDVMEDIRSMILTNAADGTAGMQVFDEEWQQILNQMEIGDFSGLERQLAQSAARFRGIALKRPVPEVPVVTLAGEIFVRRDALSRQYLTESLAGMGFATSCSPVAEWVLYCNYLVNAGLTPEDLSFFERIKFKIRNKFQARYEKKIKALLSASGLVHAEPLDMDAIIENAAPYISKDLPGEAVLTVGGALTEVVSHSCGVIAIGPFGCMPNRLSESILNEAMNSNDKLATDPDNRELRTVLTDIDELPFLAIESDGSPFPQLINAKLETFCLRAERLHQRILNIQKN
ncbi:putative CoA-substrate-specific enzyme activase [Olavius algarvensis Delta 1 endosymbiont]|nr:putative CoA-substrate-specific enzyme activase [Olavius algarvensis Delta 1 endosymbiont]